MATKTRTANIIQPQTKLGARVVDVLYLLEHTCVILILPHYSRGGYISLGYVVLMYRCCYVGQVFTFHKV